MPMAPAHCRQKSLCIWCLLSSFFCPHCSGALQAVCGAESRAPDPFRGALWDIPTTADFLGEPPNSVRRWIHHPPEGFPKFLKIGRKIVFRSAELRRWSDSREAEAESGSASNQPTALPEPESSKKPRGRPRARPQGNTPTAGV